MIDVDPGSIGIETVSRRVVPVRAITAVCEFFSGSPVDDFPRVPPGLSAGYDAVPLGLQFLDLRVSSLCVLSVLRQQCLDVCANNVGTVPHGLVARVSYVACGTCVALAGLRHVLSHRSGASSVGFAHRALPNGTPTLPREVNRHHQVTRCVGDGLSSVAGCGVGAPAWSRAGVTAALNYIPRLDGHSHRTGGSECVRPTFAKCCQWYELVDQVELVAAAVGIANISSLTMPYPAALQMGHNHEVARGPRLCGSARS